MENKKENNNFKSLFLKQDNDKNDQNKNNYNRNQCLSYNFVDYNTDIELSSDIKSESSINNSISELFILNSENAQTDKKKNNNKNKKKNKTGVENIEKYIKFNIENEKIYSLFLPDSDTN